jgi:hypothetical protein
MARRHQEAKTVAVTGRHGRRIVAGAGSTRFLSTCTSIRSHHRAINA